MNVLVAYAPCHGPTTAIAQRLAQRLRLLGFAADAQPAGDLTDIAGYDGVVLGSAMRAGQWLPEGKRFALENGAVLRQRFTWLFSVGVESAHPNPFWTHTAERLRALHRETEQVATLRHLTDPLEYRYFAVVKKRGDWTSVDAWARSIATDVTLWSAQAWRA